MKLHLAFPLALSLSMSMSACKPRGEASESAVANHEDDVGPGVSGAALQFTSAYPNPERILPHQGTDLYWCAVGADYVEVVGFNGQYPACLPGRSTLRVYPDSTQDFYLKAFKGSSEVMRVLTVIVMPLPGAVTHAEVSPMPVLEGSPAALSWYAERCDYVVVTDELDVASPAYPCGDGRIQITPQTAKTYTVRAFRRGNGHLNAYYGGTWPDQLVGINSVRVDVVKKTPQIYFEVSPREIMEDDLVNISWSVQNADQVTLTPVGPVEPQGAKALSPKETTEYRLVATRAGMAPQQQSVTVVVKPKLKIGPINLTPLDGVIRQGQGVSFNWSTKWCRHVRLELASGERASDDRACVDGYRVEPQVTTDYFVRIEDLYGGVQRLPFRVVVINEPAVAIPVTPTPPRASPAPSPTAPAPAPAPTAPVVVDEPQLAPSVVEFAANRTAVFEGETIQLTWSTANAKRAIIKFPRRMVEVPPSGQREFKVKHSGVIEIYAETDQYRSVSRTIQVTVSPKELVDQLFKALQNNQ